MNTVIVKNYPESPVSKEEILRYMGCGSEDENTKNLIDQALSLLSDKITGRVCYMELPLAFSGDIIDLGFCATISKDLRKALEGCDKILLFAATIGLETDRLILKYSHTSPSLALCLQAVGTERTESLCDTFYLDMRERFLKEGRSLRPRFSPGYGDLDIALQKDIFAALNCSKLIGLTLNESLLMSPTKSVTAIIGIKQN